jgi:hypothetical protein
VEGGEGSSSEVEAVIEMLPVMAADAVKLGHVSACRISVAYTATEDFEEGIGSVRRYIERPVDRDDLPDRLKFALASCYYDVVYPQQPDRPICPGGLIDCPVAKSD